MRLARWMSKTSELKSEQSSCRAKKLNKKQKTMAGGKTCSVKLVTKWWRLKKDWGQSWVALCFKWETTSAYKRTFIKNWACDQQGKTQWLKYSICAECCGVCRKEINHQSIRDGLIGVQRWQSAADIIKSRRVDIEDHHVLLRPVFQTGTWVTLRLSGP